MLDDIFEIKHGRYFTYLRQDDDGEEENTEFDLLGTHLMLGEAYINLEGGVFCIQN